MTALTIDSQIVLSYILYLTNHFIPSRINSTYQILNFILHSRDYFYEEGDCLIIIKVGTDVRARALDFTGVTFCQGIRFWELNFARASAFWQLLTKKCVIFDKRVKKVSHLLKNSNFCTLRFMVIRALETFCPCITFLINFAQLRF